MYAIDPEIVLEFGVKLCVKHKCCRSSYLLTEVVSRMD